MLRHRKTNGITHVTAQPLSGSAVTSQWLWPDPCCNAGVKFYKKLHYLLDSWMFTMLSASNKLIRSGNSNLTVNKFCGQPCDWCTMQWHHSGCYILLWHCLCKILWEVMVILTKTGGACLKVCSFFSNNIIVLALKRLKKCHFKNSDSFLSYRQITLQL